MKEYKKETLESDLLFDIYYTGSSNMAYLSPHKGHILQEDINLDGEIIPKGYILFYPYFDDLKIMSPEQWIKDSRCCYKVSNEDHSNRIIEEKKWSLDQYEKCEHCGSILFGQKTRRYQ